MKANEFRLGNLIELNYSDAFPERIPYFGKNIYQIKSILDDSIKVNAGIDTQQRVLLSDPKLKPIPLTEEWLMKFGFEKTYESKFRVKYDHPCDYIGFDFSKDKEIAIDGFRYYGHYIKIHYLHQLQNLYFAIAGEELSI